MTQLDAFHPIFIDLAMSFKILISTASRPIFLQILYQYLRFALCTFYLSRSDQTTAPNVHKYFRNINSLEFHEHNWNHHDKCIQKSTNMPGIGSLIREIEVTISEI